MPGMSETELKLLLPGADPAQVAQVLGRHPALRRRPREVQTLHNVYHDTPEQDLRRQKVALRVRRQRSNDTPGERWILTLKTAGTSVGGLSQRGEWESALPDATPRRDALKDSPWDTLDPDGRLWARLVPCFVTTCTRTLWLVRQRGGSEIEVALDVGEIVAGDQRAPLCELELELKAGAPEALHRLARQLAQAVAVLPGQASKAERGYALARGEVDVPTRATALELSALPDLAAATQVVLSDAWDQVLRNTALLMHSEHPEVLHQARVGWRRLRSLARLLRPRVGPAPQSPALHAFWHATGPVRELDVMLTQTLPAWEAAYVANDPQRQAEWAAVLAQVAAARAQAAAAMRAHLAAPDTGQGWLDWGEWLGAVAQQAARNTPQDWAGWVTDRLDRQHTRWKRLCKAAATERERHALRLRAKRLRYGTEAFASVLPRRQARRWLRAAGQVQQDEGARRDLSQCVAWLERLAVPAGPLAFMRGVCAGLFAGALSL